MIIIKKNEFLTKPFFTKGLQHKKLQHHYFLNFDVAFINKFARKDANLLSQPYFLGVNSLIPQYLFTLMCMGYAVIPRNEKYLKTYHSTGRGKLLYLFISNSSTNLSYMKLGSVETIYYNPKY